MHTKAEYLRKYDIIATLESPDSSIIVHYQNFGSISKAKKHTRLLQAGNKIGRVRAVNRFPKQPAAQEVKKDTDNNLRNALMKILEEDFS